MNKPGFPVGTEAAARYRLLSLVHNYHQEYVYNAAGIDTSPIVWARDMGPEKNAELSPYFSSRRVWLLDVDAALVLYPYGSPR